jgi:hypothetical protein
MRKRAARSLGGSDKGRSSHSHAAGRNGFGHALGHCVRTDGVGSAADSRSKLNI